MLRSYISDTKASLFGLSTLDLTPEQFMKVGVEKLFEFVVSDQRVERVFGDRCLAGDEETLKLMKYVEVKDVVFIPYLYECYNRYVRTHNDLVEIDAAHKERNKDRYDNGMRRDYYIHLWSLDKVNLLREYDRYALGLGHVVEVYKMDLSVLNDDLGVYNRVVIRLLDGGYDCPRTSKMTEAIRVMPKELYERYKGRIKSKHKGLLLLSPHATVEDQQQGLEAIEGRKHIVAFDTTIKQEALLSISPCKRLNVLETLYDSYGGGRWSKVRIEGVKSKEEFGRLIFSTSMKHTERVRAVIERFEIRMKELDVAVEEAD